jgi:hypothetical protein
LSFVAERFSAWKVMPEIWMAVFSRLGSGVASGLANAFSEMLPRSLMGYVSDPEEDDKSAKMTWNHSKIIAADGIEALVGGHNLNMDLFRSYPPVHDLSVVVHGRAAHGAQLYLNNMWSCNSTLLSKEHLTKDNQGFKWEKVNDDKVDVRQRLLQDPLGGKDAQEWMSTMPGFVRDVYKATVPIVGGKQPKPATPKATPTAPTSALSIRDEDLQTLKDIAEASPFAAPNTSIFAFTAIETFKPATRILSVGKYWDGPSMTPNYRCASEAMKEKLIGGATRILRLSQMDIVSAWKKKWESHTVCNWILEALVKNPKLEVQVVVSPLDGGAGIEGDQYSFGWGAIGTYFLMSHFARLDINDKPHPNAEAREKALARLHIAPFCYTAVSDVEEGKSYRWPSLPEKGYTASMNQLVDPKAAYEKREYRFLKPMGGIIGSAFEAARMASGRYYKKVPSAPGNHAKLTIIDDEAYVVGSDNLYPGFLSEFNYLIEGAQAVNDLLDSYWHPLWSYSRRHCANPTCKDKGSGRCASRVNHSTLVPNAPKLARTTSLGSLTRPTGPLLGGTKKESLSTSQTGSLLGGEKTRPRASSASDLFNTSMQRFSKSTGQLLGEHNYTSGEIYELMKHFIGKDPNVVVMGGIAPHEFAALDATAYAIDDTHQPIVAPKVIYQPYNVHFNHWGLLRIEITNNGGGIHKRRVKVLYVDPLNPDDKLGFVPLQRAFQIDNSSYGLARYQNDGGWGQHSCGAWVVWLAEQLVASNGALPAALPKPAEFAIKLREKHQMIWDVHAAKNGWQA